MGDFKWRNPRKKRYFLYSSSNVLLDPEKNIITCQIANHINNHDNQLSNESWFSRTYKRRLLKILLEKKKMLSTPGFSPFPTILSTTAFSPFSIMLFTFYKRLVITLDTSETPFANPFNLDQSIILSPGKPLSILECISALKALWEIVDSLSGIYPFLNKPWILHFF